MGKARTRKAEAIAEVLAALTEENPAALVCDGLNDAIIGIARRCGQPALLVYDRERMVKSLMRSGPMTWEEADEYLSFNVEGAWVGEGTPIILDRSVP